MSVIIQDYIFSRILLLAAKQPLRKSGKLFYIFINSDAFFENNSINFLRIFGKTSLFSFCHFYHEKQKILWYNEI